MSPSGELIAWVCEGKVYVETLSTTEDGAVVFNLTSSTLYSRYKKSGWVDVVSSYVTAYPNCLLETVDTDGRRSNLLLRLVDEHARQGWEPAKLEWLHRLLEAAPQVREPPQELDCVPAGHLTRGYYGCLWCCY
jgi:hypothetical protein